MGICVGIGGTELFGAKSSVINTIGLIVVRVDSGLASRVGVGSGVVSTGTDGEGVGVNGSGSVKVNVSCVGTGTAAGIDGLGVGDVIATVGSPDTGARVADSGAGAVSGGASALGGAANEGPASATGIACLWRAAARAFSAFEGLPRLRFAVTPGPDAGARGGPIGTF